MAKQVSPGVLALRKVVDDVHKEAREAKARGELVGWSSSKFPCELAAAFDLDVYKRQLQEAVAKYVEDGDAISFGGFTTNKKPMAAIREILRQGKKLSLIHISRKSSASPPET